MARLDSRRIGGRLRAWLRHQGLTESGLADAINAGRAGLPQVSQSWISRICNGEFKRLSGQAKVILRYANIPTDGPERPADGATVIDEAIREVWDGSDEGAQLIARLLRDAAALSKGRSTRSV